MVFPYIYISSMKLTLKQYMIANQLNKKIKREIRNCSEFERGLKEKDRLSYKLMEIKIKLDMYIRDGKNSDNIGKELEQIMEMYKNREHKYWIHQKKKSPENFEKDSVILERDRSSILSLSPTNSQLLRDRQKKVGFIEAREPSQERTVTGKYRDDKNSRTAAESVYQPSRISGRLRRQSPEDIERLSIPTRSDFERSTTDFRSSKINKYKEELEHAKIEREARKKVLHQIKSDKSLKSIKESMLASKYEEPQTSRESQYFNNGSSLLKYSRTMTPRTFQLEKN